MHYALYCQGDVAGAAQSLGECQGHKFYNVTIYGQPNYQITTVANKFGSDMLRHFGGLQNLLSPPAHVLSSSPGSQDSIEW